MSRTKGVDGTDGLNGYADGYAAAQVVTRQHATTYYWGARLLPPEQRRDVYAVYALARAADDVVDAPGATDPAAVPATAAALDAMEADFVAARAGAPAASSTIAVAAATARRRHIDPEVFTRFFAAMRRDLTDTVYPTWPDLLDYMDGSAAAIGEMMVPVLEAEQPGAVAPARSLGLAFQLTNFLRDVGEDLERGRCYLPQEDLARFGVDPSAYVGGGRVDEPWRRLMRFEIARNRELYDRALPGLAMMPPRSRRCVATALTLYARILTRIERADHDVFADRVHVPTRTKVGITSRTLIRGGARV